MLVNNAGGDIAAEGGKPKPNDCLEIPERDLHAVMDRNLLGTMNVCRAVAPAMMERREGRIVNVASVAGMGATSVGPIYAVAKAGIIHYTRCLAAQLRPYGVNVNCISPGGRRSGAIPGGPAGAHTRPHRSQVPTGAAGNTGGHCEGRRVPGDRTLRFRDWTEHQGGREAEMRTGVCTFSFSALRRPEAAAALDLPCPAPSTA